MRTTIVNMPAIIGITLLAASGSQARQPDSQPDITVCLRVMVVTAPGAIERAKLIAKTMFSSIGINLAWRGETSGHEQGVVINAALSSADYGDEENGALAETFPFAVEHDINIRYDRVHNSARISQDLEPILLAHVLVHEITHILQRVDRHSDTGVMKAHWTTDDYYDMRWKPLEFTPEDLELIRMGMQALRSHAHVGEVPSVHGQ